MECFEYNIVAAPKWLTLKNRRTKGGFARDVTDSMNDLGRDGWQFVRTQTMTERRRFFGLGLRKQHHEFMIYRRPINGAEPVEGTYSSRRAAKNIPDSGELKSRINSIVRNEDQVNKQKRDKPIGSPFEIVRSNLK